MAEQKAKLSASLEDLQDELSARTQELSILAQRLTATERELHLVLARLEQAERDRSVLGLIQLLIDVVSSILFACFVL